MSDQVGNPEDVFSHNEAKMSPTADCRTYSEEIRPGYMNHHVMGATNRPTQLK